MASVAAASVVRQIGSLYEGSSVAGMSDRELLERFDAERDAAGDAAFAALVAHHGPMVLAVCTEILGDRHHAEDAFQAVFLVLAKKARAVRDPHLLGNWLYGVALRTSRHARARLARKRSGEQAGSMAQAHSTAWFPSAEQVSLAREDSALLHAEIESLPRAFRLPIVLCYLEGLTINDAARRLRCSHGTIRSRMARAREKLRRGLVRRGVTLSAAALAGALSSRSAPAAIAYQLQETTTRSAISFATGHSAAPVSAVAQEVLRSMLCHKLRVIAMSLLFLAAGAAGARFLAQPLARSDEPKTTQVVGPARLKADATDRVPHAGQMFVAGRVFDPTGKEMSGVTVEIIGRVREPWVPTTPEPERHRLLGRGVSAAGGRFRFEASRTSAVHYFEVHALAAAPGFGLGWAELNPNAAEPTAEIRLQPEQTIRGKLFDVNGQPAAQVKLQIWSVGRPTKIGTFDGISFGIAHPPAGLSNWPRPITSDEQGRFSLAGISRDVTVGFTVRDKRFAEHNFRVETDARDGPKEFSQTLQPATVIEGKVVAADTGKPIASAAIRVSGVHVISDQNGHYAANVPPAAGIKLEVFPPEGQPYLAITDKGTYPKGTVKTTKDIKLPRGVVFRGKVIEQGSGRPIAGASVQWIAARSRDGVIEGWQAVVVTKADGSYEIVVEPGRGHLFVYGPTAGYILEVIGSGMLFAAKSGGERYYAHDIIPYETTPGETAKEMNAELRPGKIVKGRLIGPSGESVDKAEIVALLHFNYFHVNWRGDLTIHAREGSFELHGLDPDHPTRVSFLDAEHEWGATTELSGKDAGKELTIQLQPCGRAKARFVGPDGKPVARRASQLEFLGTSGPPRFTRNPEAKLELAADATYVPNLDRTHYWHGPYSDADGRITLPDLIPGATYRITDSSTMNVENKGVQVRRDFTVKPGETVDLGDILIEKPQG